MSLRWILPSLLAAVSLAAVAAERPAARGIAPGAPAPDFELARLTIEAAPDGKAIGRVSNDTLRLSSFRGKRPVCLIFSSYT